MRKLAILFLHNYNLYNEGRRGLVNMIGTVEKDDN
jgi:hypothetical protein